jgi:large subunit ribosomal protein L31
MKKGIHPTFVKTHVICNCGNEFYTTSVLKEIRVEVCSKCHPFYTGSSNLLFESGGQVDKFNKRYNKD